MAELDPDWLDNLAIDLKRTADTVREARKAEPSPGQPITAGWVRAIIRARGLRSEYLGAGIFADPAWDILLDLYASRLEGERVSVSSLCTAAAVPATTALRWIKVLEDRGIVWRDSDPGDGRRIYIVLADGAARNMAALLRAACPLSGPIF
jgi:DNA-binding MarR family transcriptional regulator